MSQRAVAAASDSSLFVGRAEDLVRVRRALLEQRVVTVVGPSGIGKSRLLRKYARREAMIFCDLRNVQDVDAMIAAIVFAAGGERCDDPMRAAERVLSARGEVVLALDNVEPLLPLAGVVIERLLAAAPSLRVLCGSRAAIGIDGESIVELRGLDDERAADLISDRLRTVGSDRPIGRASMITLARKLGGVPLAIELAAARFGRDGGGVLQRLVGLPDRYDDDRAVQRAVDRAWTLLDDDERELLSEASVCRGGITLDRLIAISGLGARAADVALALARRGLFEVVDTDPIRLVMAESVRAQAEEVLQSNGRTHAVRLRHLRAFDAAPNGDRENVRAAIAFAITEKLFDVALRLLLSLDDVSRDLPLLDLAIGATRDRELLSRALSTRAAALHAMGKLTESLRDAETALELARDPRQTAVATRAIGLAHFQLGELDDARRSFETAIGLQRELGDRGAVAALMQNLGAVLASLGELELARIHHENALALAVESEDPHAEARAIIGLGSLWLEIGDLTRARGSYERGLARARALRMTRTERIVLGYLGIVELDANRPLEAEAQLRTAASTSGDAGDVRVESIFEGIRGAALAMLDRVDESRAAFARAEDGLCNNRFFAEVIAIHRGHLDLAEGNLVSARRRALDGREAAIRSDDARVALRILERAIP